MFTGAGVKTEAGGNIGKPYSELVSENKPLDVITLEVSSFQLERILRFRPEISVWLNLTPDHLDRYADEAEYREAKLRIFENQTAADCAVVNFRDQLPPLSPRRLTFSAYEAGGGSPPAQRDHPLPERAAARSARDSPAGSAQHGEPDGSARGGSGQGIIGGPDVPRL